MFGSFTGCLKHYSFSIYKFCYNEIYDVIAWFPQVLNIYVNAYKKFKEYATANLESKENRLEACLKFWGTFQFYFLVLGPIFSLLSFYSWNLKYKRLYDFQSS